MTADEVELDRVPLEGRLQRFGVGQSQAPVKACQLRRRSRLRIHRMEHRTPESGGEGKALMGQQGQLCSLFPRRNSDKGNVDSISRSAAHDAGNRHDLRIHTR